MRPEKAQDTQYQETTITKAQGGPEAGWSVTMADGWSLFIDKDSPIIPKEGMKIRTYGKGIGYKIRGIDLDGQEVFYRTPNEEEERHRKWVEDQNRQKKEEFESNREDTDRRVAALPKFFQDRLEKFRKNNPDFRWEYEPYELFCCEEAVKIAETLKTVDAIKAWHALPYKEQKKQVALAEGHSGNTFGCATSLAIHYLTNPENVVKLHGALAPLVGSEEYGCIPKGS